MLGALRERSAKHTYVDEREYQKLSIKHKKNMRTPEIQQKSSEINDSDNEPRHIWRLPGVSGVPMGDN